MIHLWVTNISDRVRRDGTVGNLTPFHIFIEVDIMTFIEIRTKLRYYLVIYLHIAKI